MALVLVAPRGKGRERCSCPGPSTTLISLGPARQLVKSFTSVDMRYSLAMRPAPREPLDDLAALAEPVRRRLYEYVVAQPGAVDRDGAAGGLGIGRPLAAFHLDRLAEAGLLEVEYHRRSGRTGPGAGRPAKFYRRPAGRDIEVSLPPRRYGLVAEIFATGIRAERRRRRPSGRPRRCPGRGRTPGGRCGSGGRPRRAGRRPAGKWVRAVQGWARPDPAPQLPVRFARRAAPRPDLLNEPRPALVTRRASDRRGRDRRSAPGGRFLLRGIGRGRLRRAIG